MWSGAHGNTHDSGARGPGFDPTPKPRTAFFSEALISLLSDNRLENDVILWCQVEINNIIKKLTLPIFGGISGWKNNFSKLKGNFNLSQMVPSGEICLSN